MGLKKTDMVCDICDLKVGAITYVHVRALDKDLACCIPCSEEVKEVTDLFRYPERRKVGR
jgi:hypothetical protein